MLRISELVNKMSQEAAGEGERGAGEEGRRPLAYRAAPQPAEGGGPRRPGAAGMSGPTKTGRGTFTNIWATHLKAGGTF